MGAIKTTGHGIALIHGGVNLWGEIRWTPIVRSLPTPHNVRRHSTKHPEHPCTKATTQRAAPQRSFLPGFRAAAEGSRPWRVPSTWECRRPRWAMTRVSHDDVQPRVIRIESLGLMSSRGVDIYIAEVAKSQQTRNLWRHQTDIWISTDRISSHLPCKQMTIFMRVYRCLAEIRSGAKS
jgi:hypothetical protein